MSLFNAEDLYRRRGGDWDEKLDVTIDRQREYEELERVLSRFDGDTDELIVAIGPTGSGKTTLVQQCLDECTPFTSFESTVIDCADSNTVYRTFIRTVNALRSDSNSLSSSGYSFDVVREILQDEIASQPEPTILCFDDIQHLDSLGPVCSLATLTDVHVICTADVEEMSDDALPDVDCTTTIITFQEYTAEQLRTLLEKWVEEASEKLELSAEVIPLCAAYAAEDGGNARLGIELLERASSIAFEASVDQVRGVHVQNAKEEYESAILQMHFESLDQHSQLVLRALARLLKMNDVPARTTTVYDEYASLAAEVGVEPLAQRRMSDRLQELCSRELVSYTVYNDGRNGGKYRKYDLEPDPSSFGLNTHMSSGGNAAAGRDDSLF